MCAYGAQYHPNQRSLLHFTHTSNNVRSRVVLHAFVMTSDQLQQMWVCSGSRKYLAQHVMKEELCGAACVALCALGDESAFCRWRRRRNSKRTQACSFFPRTETTGNYRGFTSAKLRVHMHGIEAA
jgi:hypothetical protein